MKDNSLHSALFLHRSRLKSRLIRSMGVIACGLSLAVAEPMMAQEVLPSFVVRTEQGEVLRCQSSQSANATSIVLPIGPTAPNASNSSVICQRQLVSAPIQPMDGTTDMVLKLIYLGLPAVLLVGVSLRTLYLHRQVMRQRAFVESLERIWQRSVSY